MEIVKSPEELGLLIKGISDTIKHEAKEQRNVFFLMLLETLAASVLGNELTEKGVIKVDEGRIRAVRDF